MGFASLTPLLRFERQPAYVEAVLTAYSDRRGTPQAAAPGPRGLADLGATPVGLR